MTGGLLQRLSHLCRRSIPSDPAFERAVVRLDRDVGPSTLLAGVYGTLGVGGLAAAVAWRFVGPVALAAVAGCSALAALVLYAGPLWLAATRRAQTLGEAPELVAMAVLSLHAVPSLEEAAGFATRHGRGHLADSLREHVRRSRGTPATGWTAFATHWRDAEPALARAADLLVAAVDASPADRDQLLDRALGTILDETESQLATFAADLRGPVTALYAFGVVLPLALIATLPAARSAGVAVPPTALAVLYDLGLPALLGVAVAWVLARRPVAFRSAAVAQSHPALPRWRLGAPVAGLAAGITAWVVAGQTGLGWIRPISGAGLAVGVTLVSWYEPVRQVRQHGDAVEAGLPDALSLAGRRLRRGRPPETAVESVGASLDGPTGDVFESAARNSAVLGVDVETAFTGDRGALADVPSPRTAAAASLLALAGRHGGEAGETVIHIADHVADLARVESEGRRELATIAGTLRSTACCFGPLVGGATVALADRIGGVPQSTAVTAPLSTATLGLIVGWYVLVLAALLATFAAALDNGVDRQRIGYAAGVAISGAAISYPASFALAASVT
ncbi:MAG: hypothetical protein ABEJ08_04800 [Halobacteriaceae archaeon]